MCVFYTCISGLVMISIGWDYMGPDGTKRYLKVSRSTSRYPEVHLSTQKCPEVSLKYPEVPKK